MVVRNWFLGGQHRLAAGPAFVGGDGQMLQSGTEAGLGQLFYNE